jgi:NAD-dependent dihydropyrimidine dehydrogenase PreA subunit
MESLVIQFNLTNCTRCRTCVDSCFVDVLRWDEREQMPLTAYPEDCVWCYACELACPMSCIDVKPAGARPIPTPY